MLRNFLRSDLQELLRIEESIQTVPWTENTFKTCFQSGCLGWVAEHDRKVIGFILMTLHLQECHILNLCVSLPYQHQGWGRKLLEHAMSHAKEHGAGIIYLEVRRSNTRAISLYTHAGFQLIGERKEYYPTLSGHEDALVFAKSLYPSLYP